jgi:hypothetical protein
MNPCDSTERAGHQASELAIRRQVVRDPGVKRTITDDAGDCCERRGRIGIHPGGCKHNEVSNTHKVKQTPDKGGTL